jgi:hypothetical protein
MDDLGKIGLNEVVVVEGSLTPAMGYLKRGEQAEVAFSENVADLHRRGYVIVRGKPSANPVTPGVPVAPGQSVPSVPVQKPDQSVPSVPSGTNQDLVQAAPPPPEGNPVTPDMPQGTNQDLVEAAPPEEPKPNPDVDNSLVDVNAKPASAKSSSTSTSSAKK